MRCVWHAQARRARLHSAASLIKQPPLPGCRDWEAACTPEKPEKFTRQDRASLRARVSVKPTSRSESPTPCGADIRREAMDDPSVPSVCPAAQARARTAQGVPGTGAGEPGVEHAQAAQQGPTGPPAVPTPTPELTTPATALHWRRACPLLWLFQVAVPCFALPASTLFPALQGQLPWLLSCPAQCLS